MSENQMDMLKMMEQAMALKSMMGFGEKEEDNTTTKNNFMDIAQMMQMFSKNNEDNGDDENNKIKEISNEREVFFDDVIYTSEIKTLKAAIPYLKYEQQKNMAMFIKVIELKKLKEMYDNNDVNIMIKKENGEGGINMLSAVRKHMPPDKQQFIDIYIKFLEINKMIKKTNQNEGLI